MGDNWHGLDSLRQAKREFDMENSFAAANRFVQTRVLPSGWSALQDPRSGRTYYLNSNTKTTQWEIPTPSSVPKGDAIDIMEAAFAKHPDKGKMEAAWGKRPTPKSPMQAENDARLDSQYSKKHPEPDGTRTICGCGTPIPQGKRHRCQGCYLLFCDKCCPDSTHDFDGAIRAEPRKCISRLHC